ncbi:MAG TPA: hypothetical protein VFO98_08885 [Marmoricola sp.]|nr:hypothetical protein [Marmoricola sp.]
MATTTEPDPATAQQYATQVAITAALVGALRGLWPSANPLSSPAALSSYREGVAVVVDRFAALSAQTAADYYQTLRRTDAVPGTYRPRLVEPPPRSLVDAGIDYALRAESAEDIEAAIMARVDSVMQKAVADIAREQVVDAVEGDEKAIGFRRIPRPDACSWCLSLAIRSSTRGAKGERHIGVYKSRESAGQLPPNVKGEVNRYHNNCHCVVEPVFSPVEQLPDWLADVEQLYSDATEHSERGESLNDFRRALAARRRGEEPTPVPTPSLAPTTAPRDALQALLGRIEASMRAA